MLDDKEETLCHPDEPDLITSVAVRVACDALFADAMSVYATRSEPLIAEDILSTIRECRVAVIDCVSLPVDVGDSPERRRCPPGWDYDPNSNKCVARRPLVDGDGDPTRCGPHMHFDAETGLCVWDRPGT